MKINYHQDTSEKAQVIRRGRQFLSLSHTDRMKSLCKLIELSILMNEGKPLYRKPNKMTLNKNS